MSIKSSKARQLVEKGFYIIPLHNPTKNDSCSCGHNCGSTGKHPRISDWPNKASRDPDQVREWWRRWPDANIGIVCGKQSDLVVLDVDPRHGGEKSLDKLEKEIGCFTQTATVVTGGGGKHFYFRYPGAGLLSNSSGQLGDGLDLKTDGGLIVAPGSQHGSGDYYKWLIGMEQIKSFPQSVIDYLDNLQSMGDHSDISTALSSIEPIPEGKRNDTLFNMGVKLRERGMTQQQMYNELADINAKRCNPPLGMGEVRQISENASTPPSNRLVQSGEVSDEDYGLWNTDFGNARELVDGHGENIKFNLDEQEWLVWDHTRWKYDLSGLHVMRKAKNLVEVLYDSADTEEKQKHMKKSANEARLKAMMNLSATSPDIMISSQELDTHPAKFTLENLTIDFKSEKLIKHNPNHLMTKKVAYHYKSDAECPLWEQFIAQIMDYDGEMIRFLQQAVGYSLTGYTTEQCLFFLYGSGRNGKSTFVEVLLRLLGEYAIKANAELIMDRSHGSGIPNDVARLKGHRLVVLSEVQEGKKLDEAKVKNLTGEDTITARFLRKEYFEFEPTHKLWIFGNHKPMINGTDEGIWRRMLLINFGVTIPKKDVDPHLKSKLLDELPGIFNWALKGFKLWKESGRELTVPESVRKDTLSYRNEMDILNAFLSDCCKQNPTLKCSNKELRASYIQWCEDNGVPPMSVQKMSPKLEERGLAKYKSNGCVHWKGLAVA